MKTLITPMLMLLLASAGCGGASAGSNDVVRISQIQGAGNASPLLGESVTIVAVVSGDFQSRDTDSDDLGGFYAQQETPDADPLTSDGIFVFDGRAPTVDVVVGDRVRVVGVVQEYFGETQIAVDTVTIIGSGTIQATDVTLPGSDVIRSDDGYYVADLERFEGMLVRFEQQLTVSNLRFLERFGAVGLASGGRLMQFTNNSTASTQGYEQHRLDTAKRTIVLDDGRRDNNPQKIRYLNAADGEALRVGDSISGLVGNLRFSRGSGGNGDQTWRVMPTAVPAFSNSNPRPVTPPVTGRVRVASVNVLNYFTGIDTSAANCGPEKSDGCRGADSRQELARQTQKTISAIAPLEADIIGLMELENNDDSLSTLADALNARLGSTVYRHIETGTIHNDTIKTGFLYNVSTVRPLGDFSILDSSTDSRFNDNLNRPALAQSFVDTDSGGVVTVVVNHFKSKGSSCADDGDTNADDGQGECNGIRTSAATALAEWIGTDPTDSNDPDFLLIGDFNAYLNEDPLIAFRNAGLINLLQRTDGAYTMNYDGQSGALDHALATASLDNQVVSAMAWHINADEAPLHDYNLEHGRDAGLFDADLPYRASDHDPVIVDLDLVN